MTITRLSRSITASIALAVAIATLAACGTSSTPARTGSSTPPNVQSPDPSHAATSTPLTLKGAGTMHVTSTDLTEGQPVALAQVFAGNGCTGANRSPQLTWTGAPSETKSFAITMYDPDAPTGSGFWHWVAYNVNATTTSVPSGSSTAQPSYAQATNDYGAAGYGGPCPPKGPAHRYVTTIYALDIPSLGLPAEASNAFVRFTIMAHTLATGSLTATYAVAADS